MCHSVHLLLSICLFSLFVCVSLSGDTFSDVSNPEQRELCLGFVEQIKSGKPIGVLNMVMKSRGITQSLIDRVGKAAGGGGGGGAGNAAALSAAIKKSAPASSSAADEKKKEKKEKKQ